MRYVVQVTSELINKLGVDDKLLKIAPIYIDIVRGNIPVIPIASIRHSSVGFNEIELDKSIAHYILSFRNMSMNRTSRVRLSFESHTLDIMEVPGHVHDTIYDTFDRNYRQLIAGAPALSDNIARMRAEDAKLQQVRMEQERMEQERNRQAQHIRRKYGGFIESPWNPPVAFDNRVPTCGMEVPPDDMIARVPITEDECYKLNKSGRAIPKISPDKEVKISINKLNKRRK
jgi:hypothetical protein